MKIHPGRIGFDIDGVVADTMEAFIRLAREDHGVDSISPEDITDFEVEDCLEMDPAVMENIFVRLMVEPVAAGLRPMAHAVDVLQEAFYHHGKPEIVNTDQGSQFTADEFVQAVKDQGCKISMDGRGAWRDNVIVERLWKSVK